MVDLTKAPFHLDDAQVAWVEDTLAAMGPQEKAGQLFVHLSRGSDPGELPRLARLKPGGITRFFMGGLEEEANFLDAAQAQAEVPLLVSSDLEGSRMSLPFGTEVPNPLALAAVDDLGATRQVAQIMAREAAAIGVNWTFTPVIDINAAFRSPIVATRGLGSDPVRIKAHALATIAEFQAQGVAATVKHWPGEGHDDRDQHLVTTIIPLSVEEWEATHGALYRAAIEAGVMSVMSAHIAFPAMVRAEDPDSGVEAFRPASVSPILTEDLLRRRLGFNGVIVSDATPMAGFGAWAPRSEMLPEVIMAGCDVILFSNDPEGDHALIEAAVADGRITAARLDEAVRRVLGLKAALGLHRGVKPAAREKIGTKGDREAARAVTARAPTLVKDVKSVLPLSVDRYRRVLVISGGVVFPFMPVPLPLELPDMLRAEGFEVTVYEKGMQIEPKDWDLMIYAFAEETLLTRGRIFLDWLKLMGDFGMSMRRWWHEVPTVMISFGYPYMLYDAPRVPCYINAYSSMTSMQAAVVDCLVGRTPFEGRSPVDPFCGLEDARY
ncbi:glycoside hydrolase family 3 protein [Thioclava sp. FR2]|uniref:glycoside hydrolase family 3 protein n=1 Tax=Thioclava sp. FR2 TaxID=3445780 RepID=UPI003EBD241A